MEKEYQRNWRQRNSEYYKAYHREWARKWRAANPEKAKLTNRKSNNKRAPLNKLRDLEIKKAVMEAYGGQCACCGEAGLPFLSIDHIIPVRDDYRKRPTGIRFYRLLQKQSIDRTKYQILCFNCNVAKGINNACPHQLI